MGTADAIDKSEVQRLFGLRVRELRRARGLTQWQLAEAASLEHSYVGNCEQGRKNTTIFTLHRLAVALGVAPEELLRPPSGE
jgi:transcriptional regulator with XRE-family HTH domain